MIDRLECDAIRAILPHRFPMLLVDRIIELQPGKRAVGIKNVTVNEPFFQGHFPMISVMPGVLIVEAMAQVAGVMILTCPEHRGKIPFIASIDSVRYYHPVLPGDTLMIEANVVWVRSHLGRVGFETKVGSRVVAKGDIRFALKAPPPPAEEQLVSLGIYGSNEQVGKQGE